MTLYLLRVLVEKYAAARLAAGCFFLRGVSMLMTSSLNVLVPAFFRAVTAALVFLVAAVFAMFGGLVLVDFDVVVVKVIVVLVVKVLVVKVTVVKVVVVIGQVVIACVICN